VAEIAALAATDINLSTLGFDERELNRLLALARSDEVGPAIDPDDIPEPPTEASTQRGDLWILGSGPRAHRILCGDSADPSDVDRLMDGQAAHLVITDPPYNVRVEPRSNNAIAAGLSSFESTRANGQGHHQGFDEARHGKRRATHKNLRPRDRPLANDFVSKEDYEALLGKWFGNIARILLPGHGFYVWGGYANAANYPQALEASGLYFSQAIIWSKGHPVLTRKDFMGAHEWAFYGWKEGAAHRFFGPPNIPDLWEVAKINPQSMLHLTEKPVELARRSIEYSSRRGENVVDLFGGVGWTVIAAEQLGRRCFVCELDGLYVDILVKRYERFTGLKARRISKSGGKASSSSKTVGART
jgi:DNA modification methylase